MDCCLISDPTRQEVNVSTGKNPRVVLIVRNGLGSSETSSLQGRMTQVYSTEECTQTITLG